MSANSNNKSDVSNNEGQLVAVDQSSALQVETLGAIGGLQEQIESVGRPLIPSRSTLARTWMTTKGGVHQSHCPVWIFVVTLRQVSRSRRIGGLPYQNSTMCRRRCSGGVGTEPLRSILGLCFRELTVEDLKMWERHMERTHKWPQSLKALRLYKCKEEAERQGVDIPPWYLLDGVTGLQVARPYNPVDDTELVDQQENTDYAVSAPLPSCAIWDLLDTQGGGYSVAVDSRLVEVRGGTIHRRPRGVDAYHDESLAASSVDGEPMSSVVRWMGRFPQRA